MAQTATRVVRRIPSEALFTTGQYRKPQMVVAAYARVSTEKEEQEDSFDRQVQHYTTLITSKPEWQFGGIYADPGITGTRAEKRPDFMRMIQACRDGKINKVLVKSISRFARNTVDALNYIRELKDLGISVYFENENIDTMTPGGEVLLTILAAMAEQESRTMSTNIKWSYQKKFQNGEVVLNTGMVLGYKKSSTGEYVIAEDEAETVLRIYREYLAGIPVPQICRELEADGITTKRGSAQWRPNAVLGILKNEKYTGNAILGKTFKPDVLSKRRMKNTGQSPMYYAENTHPAIITQEMLIWHRQRCSAAGMKRIHPSAVVDTPVNTRSVVCWYAVSAVIGYADMYGQLVAANAWQLGVVPTGSATADRYVTVTISTRMCWSTQSEQHSTGWTMFWM